VRQRARSGLLFVALALAFSACGDDTGQVTTTSRARSSSGSSGSSAGSSGSSGVVGTGSSLDEICWSTINEHRKKDGLPPFERWTDGEACADGEAKTDGTNNDPHGSFPKCGELAQNECPGFKGPVESGLPDCLGFMYAQPKGEGHHDNMASTKWKKVACGVFVMPNGDFWSVQNYR